MTRTPVIGAGLAALLASPAFAATTEKVINIVPSASDGSPGTNWLLIAVLAAVAIVFFGVMIGGLIGKSSS